jgi:dolichol-phosphate mannosyltransferase
VALVRPGGDRWRLDGQSVELVEADLRDTEAVRTAVDQARPDLVFHLAAHGAYSWQRDSTGIMQSALLGTVALVDAVAEQGCERLVNAGSSSEYGFKDHPPREDEPVEPNSPYAVAKAAATMYCSMAARERGLATSTLRLYSAYGPLEDPRRLISRLVEHGLRSELPPLVAPDTARDFVYVDDVIDAFLAAADRAEPGAVYNIGSGRQTTLGELVELARDELEIAAEPDWGSAAARDWDTSVWVSDPGLAREQLGWTPRVGLREGLRLTADWLRDSPERDRYAPAP